MDYLEIMDFCGFDMEKAHKMVQELRETNDVDSVEPESHGEDGGGLFGESRCAGPGCGLGNCLFADSGCRICNGGYAEQR